MSDSTLAVIVALAGGVGALIGAALGAGLAQYGRRQEHQWKQQRADASVLGPVMAFLTYADPDRLGFSVRPAAAGQEDTVMSPLRDRLDEIFSSLLGLSAGHPDEHVGDLAGKLAIAVRNTFNSSARFVDDLIRQSDRSYQEAAKKDHEHARKLADELLAEIARYGRRRRRRSAERILAKPSVRPEDIVTHVTRCQPRE